MEVRAVIGKTLRRWLSLVFVLALLGSVLRAQEISDQGLRVTISMHNDAGVSAATLRGAELEASRVFRQSGIEVRWLNCPLPPQGPENPQSSESPRNPDECAASDFPRHLQLRIAKRSLNLNKFAMGISYLSADGVGCYADLFYQRVAEMHETSQVNMSSILGHGIAHEIGHLLLGTNSHSAIGIMRVRWERAELTSVSKGTLFFSAFQSRQMRTKLASWPTQARGDSHIAALQVRDYFSAMDDTSVASGNRYMSGFATTLPATGQSVTAFQPR